ncbi:MAG: hypothetical protein ACTSWY_02280, partial [Promethearchaeota archaeon]
EQAVKHRYMILILDLLKALTCYKIGRPDLFQTFTAFSRLRQGYNIKHIRVLLKKAGYNLLLNSEEIKGN